MTNQNESSVAAINDSANTELGDVSGWRHGIHKLLDSVGIWPLVVGVALVQSVVLGSMIWDRMTLLKTGKEVIVDVLPVDPRSLFRGDYVILNYEISQIDRGLVTGNPKRRDVVYVTLQKAAGNETEAWSAISVGAQKPEAVRPNQIVVRAKVTGFGSRPVGENKDNIKTIRLKYGAERYFVEEGEGKVIENQIADKKIQVIWAVDASGEAAVKALMVDGARVYDEPLF